MNPVIIVHLVGSFVVAAGSIPLVAGRVKRNPWYGVRIPEAFESEERWRQINAYGGRLLLAWSMAIASTALIGMFLPRSEWVAYNLSALVVVMGGLTLVLSRIRAYARRANGS